MTNPIAITKARKIAEQASGRSLSVDRVWIEQPHAVGLEVDQYQVRYTLPRTTGFFVANLALALTADEFSEYEHWAIARNAAN